MLHDLNVNAPVDQGFQRIEDRRVGELIGRDAQRIARHGLVDVAEAGLEQAARQPDDFGIPGVIDVLWRLVAELLGEVLAGDGAAVELHPMRLARAPFLLGRDLERDFVPEIGG